MLCYRLRHVAVIHPHAFDDLVQHAFLFGTRLGAEIRKKFRSPGRRPEAPTISVRELALGPCAGRAFLMRGSGGSR